MKLDRPVLVTGTPRAGKTLVAKMFAATEEFFYLYEPKEIWDIGLGRRDHDRRTAEDATPEVREAIRERLQKYLRDSGRSRYVEELSRHALRTPFIFSVLPEVRLIFVVRHPRLAIPEMMRGWRYRDSATRKLRRGRAKRFDWRTSPNHLWQFAVNYVRVRLRGRRATWGPMPPGLAEFAKSHSTAEVAAFQWASLYSTALDDLEDLPANQWMIVRYENLMTDLRHQIERIAEFAEVKDASALQRAGNKIIDPNWVATNPDPPPQPSESEWEAIRRNVEPVQRRLGYTAWDANATEQSQGKTSEVRA